MLEGATELSNVLQRIDVKTMKQAAQTLVGRGFVGDALAANATLCRLVRDPNIA